MMCAQATNNRTGGQGPLSMQGEAKMAQRFGTIVTGALAGVLALGAMAGTARAQDTSRDTSRVQSQDTTHRARTSTTRRKSTTRNRTSQQRRDSAGMRSDTSAYRSMDTRSDSMRMRDSINGRTDTMMRTDTTVRTDTTTVRTDTTGTHFNRDSAQTAPRAGTTNGLPGVQGPPPGGIPASPGSISPAVPPRADTSSANPAPTPATPPNSSPTTTTTPPPR
jgi:hypothetical protein